MSPVPDPALRAYYAARAREYEAVYAKPERQSDLLRLAFWLRETLADRQVLEVACGTGFWTERFAPVCRGVIACDLSEEVLVVAREKTWPEGRVRFEVADAYRLPQSPVPCDAAFGGFWWSHVPRAQLTGFLEGLHRRLKPGSIVAFCDNRFVPGSNTPIHRTDSSTGDTFQLRQLADGSIHEVLKNFPDEAELRSALPGGVRDVEWVGLEHFWALRYRLG